MADQHTSTAYPDAAYSPLCLVDDRAPQHGRPATGQSVGDCNNYVPHADVTTVDVTNSTLKDLSGNDGVFGTADDAWGLDFVSGTGDEPNFATITRTVPAISVTWNFQAPMPAFKTPMAPVKVGNAELTGVGYWWFFRNKQVNRNILYPLCKGSGAPGAPPEVRDYQGHYLDNWMFALNFEWGYNGAVYAPSLNMYVFDPDKGIFNYFGVLQYLVDTAYNARDNDGSDPNYPDSKVPVDSNTGLGHFYNITYGADRKSVTATIPGVIIDRSNGGASNTSCAPVRSYTDTDPTHTKTQGVHNFGIMRQVLFQTAAQKASGPFKGFDASSHTTNDTISDMSWSSSISTSFGTPRIATCELVAALCNTPGEIEEDAIGVIGLSGTVDVFDKAGAPQQLGGLDSFPNAGNQNLISTTPWLSYSPGNYPACPLPTFGGRLPANPLWIPGQPCATEHPLNAKYLLTGVNAVFGAGLSNSG